MCGGGVEYLRRGDGEFAELETAAAGGIGGGIGGAFVRHVVAVAARTEQTGG